MKNDHYEEEARKQAVDEEIEDIKKKENAPSEYKSKGEIVKETSSKLKRFFRDFIEGIVIVSIISFVVFQWIIPPSGPPYEEPILGDYLFAVFVAVAMTLGYFFIKHKIKSRKNKGYKD